MITSFVVLKSGFLSLYIVMLMLILIHIELVFDYFFCGFCLAVRMYNNLGAQPGVVPPQTSAQPNPFGSAFQVAGSGLIRGGLGAYGGKILGSSSEYVQSNVRT
jgi:hypothetical protein